MDALSTNYGMLRFARMSASQFKVKNVPKAKPVLLRVRGIRFFCNYLKERPAMDKNDLLWQASHTHRTGLSFEPVVLPSFVFRPISGLFGS